MKLDEITNKRKIIGEINPNDEFYTPDYAIIPLLKYLKQGNKILCPFDTIESNFVKTFTINNYEVDFSSLSMGEDFFEIDFKNKNIDYIISNPPYSKKTEVFEKLFSLNIPFAMLVGVVGLFESQKRFNLFRDNDFEVMYFNKRISYFRNYNDQKPDLNPPFSSVYICKGILPKQIVFETIIKK